MSLYDPATFPEGGRAEEAAAADDDDESSEVSGVQAHRHKGAVLALDFCPSAQHMLASAGADGEVAVVDAGAGPEPRLAHTLRAAAASAAASAQSDGGDGFECVAWNRSVASVIAGASSAGTITIWDLRKKSPAILTFTDGGRRVRWRGMAWDPSEATVLAACCDEDDRPVALWDLRSVQMPRHFAGHRRGVWSLSWSPHDSSLVVTSGKDRTLCWNPATLEVRREITVADHEHGADTAAAAQSDEPAVASEERWDAMAAWSPRLPGTLALCSFGAQRPRLSMLCVHDPSMPAPAPPAAALPPPPQWLRRPVGVAFGFGGRAAFFRRPAPATKAVKPVHRLCFARLAADEELAARAESFKSTTENGKLEQYCADHEGAAANAEERTMWALLNAHLKGQNIRQSILALLGFDREKIAAELALLAAEPAGGDGGAPVPAPTPAGDKALLHAVAVGDFERAVEYCVSVGRHADALAIASMGGNELFARTREAFVAREWASREWMKMLSAINEGGVERLVETVNTKNWRVALAAICAYAKDTAVASLASMLGDRLRKADDDASALLCFIVAGNTAEVTAMWIREAAASAAPKNETLAATVEKLTVLKHAVAAGEEALPDEALAKFIEYGVLLASQGNAALAVHYLGFLAEPRFQHTPGAVLLDRLANSGAPLSEGMKRSTSPFHPMVVGGSLAHGASSAPKTAPPAAMTPARQTRPQVVPPLHPAATPTAARPGVAVPTPQRSVAPQAQIPAPVATQQAMPLPIPAPSFMPSPAAARPMMPSPARVTPASLVPPIPAPAAAAALPPPQQQKPPVVAPPRMFVPPSPVAPQQQQLQQPLMSSPTTTAPMQMAMAGTQAVLPTAPRPKPEALTTSLAETVSHDEPADPADIDAIRAHLASALPELERHAAGTTSEPHVAEVKAKLEVLAPILHKLSKPTVASVAAFCRALGSKDWASADAVLAAITKDHSKELTTPAVIGLRFLGRLSKMLLK